MDDLISRQEAMNHIENEYREWGDEYDAVQILGDLEDFPSAQQEIIRCGDCKYFDDRPGWQGCQAFGKWFGETEMYANDFCSKAEKREDG